MPTPINRRRFLVSSATATAALGFPAILRANEDRKLRVAVVGLGDWCCHINNGFYKILEPAYPTSVECLSQTNFAYAGPMTAASLMGNIAARVGERIDYDADQNLFNHNEAATRMMHRHHARPGWYV